MPRWPVVIALLAAGSLVACSGPSSHAAEPAARGALSVGPRDAAPDPDAYAPFGEHRVAYSDSGGGPEALVLVHGWGSDRRVWDEQLDSLSRAHRVIAVDLLGHGRSDKPELPYTMDVLADSLDAVLEHAGVRRAVLVGHSNGTPVIRQLLRRHPAHVAGLVAVDGALRAFTDDPAEIQRYASMFQGDDYLVAVEAMGRQALSPQLPEPRREELLAMMRAVPQHVLVSSLVESFDADVWAPDRIDVPLLVIRAQQPRWDDDARRFAESLAPQLEYHVLEGVTHFLMLDEPHVFRHLIEDFVLRRELLGPAPATML